MTVCKDRYFLGIDSKLVVFLFITMKTLCITISVKEWGNIGYIYIITLQVEIANLSTQSRIRISKKGGFILSVQILMNYWRKKMTFWIWWAIDACIYKKYKKHGGGNE